MKENIAEIKTKAKLVKSEKATLDEPARIAIAIAIAIFPLFLLLFSRSWLIALIKESMQTNKPKNMSEIYETRVAQLICTSSLEQRNQKTEVKTKALSYGCTANRYPVESEREREEERVGLKAAGD